jgi:hypothetical protein
MLTANSPAEPSGAALVTLARCAWAVLLFAHLLLRFGLKRLPDSANARRNNSLIAAALVGSRSLNQKSSIARLSSSDTST